MGRLQLILDREKLDATRVKSATATTIEHRWYQGNRMRQVVQLRIEANPGTGYRAYSRQHNQQ
jgi:hypothetical protein